VDKDKLKSEIKRVKDALDSKEGHFIREELKQYLKMLKRELKEKE
jgi:hypothetical protein